MAYRGSLRQCVTAAYFNFDANNYPMLAILCNPSGKYYTLTPDPDEFLNTHDPSRSHHRIVFHGTRKELEQFANFQQLKLFEEKNDRSTP